MDKNLDDKLSSIERAADIIEEKENLLRLREELAILYDNYRRITDQLILKYQESSKDNAAISNLNNDMLKLQHNIDILAEKINYLESEINQNSNLESLDSLPKNNF